MPRNEDGEFEVLLGTRQLLSGFFIIVVLFGVLFAMGYIVGRHSAPETLAASTTHQDATPIRAASPDGPAPGEAEIVTEAPRQPASAEAADPQAATTTQPATAPPESPSPVTAGRTEPAPGRYLQVAAPRRTAAGGVIESLKNKGIAAVLAPGPDEETVRVLVGPLQPADVGKMRSDLESAGFKPFVKNY
jgi:hypothetical protein